MKPSIIRIRDAAVDLIWPVINKVDGQSDLYSDYLRDTHPKYLPAIEYAVEKLIDQEEERRKTVDLKVISLLSLIPVATTILIATMVAITNQVVAQEGKATGYDQWLILTIYCSGGYTALQLFRAMYGAIGAQAATGYHYMTFPEMNPKPKESVSDHKSRIINQRMINNIHNQLATNQKVDQMKIAHRAIINALPATALLTAAIVTQGFFTIW